MSFLQHEEELIRDLWPEDCSRPSDDMRTMLDLEDWQHIPINIDNVCDIVEVVNDGIDSSGAIRHRLVYKDREVEDTEDDKMFEVCLRLQGTVKNNKIGPLGDWNGSPSSCPRAVQRLVLSGSLDERVSALQDTGIGILKDFIHQSIKSKPPRSAGTSQTDDLVLERRLFTKVRPNVPVKSALLRGDDPDGAAKKVEKQWKIAHRIGYSLQLDDGTYRACSNMAIRTGDFVDVGVIFEIFTRFSKGQRVTSISLAVQDILRLQTSDVMEVIKFNVEMDRKKGKEVIATSSGLKPRA